jgi:hypothetical protein
MTHTTDDIYGVMWMLKNIQILEHLGFQIF